METDLLYLTADQSHCPSLEGDPDVIVTKWEPPGNEGVPVFSESDRIDQFGLCSITLGLEFPVFYRDPRDTPFTTPL